MGGKIYSQSRNGKVYYYYQEGYREKVDTISQDKGPGSGKSRVRTRSIYLGNAEKILSELKEKQIPISVEHRSFGLVAAAYQTAKEYQLLEILQKHITGNRFGVDRWLYFLVTILNRLDHASSKNKIGRWFDQTILPRLIKIKRQDLTSKKFWYVTDDVISEKELWEKREKSSKNSDDIFCGLDDRIFQKMEEEFFEFIYSSIQISSEALVYDTTNFFTFFDSDERSELALTGHNKEGRHNLRQIGLSMAVEQRSGIPFFHRVYRGNSQDANTFHKVIKSLMQCIQKSFGQIDEIVLVLDKGNNKKETFEFLSGKIEWVGSLTPTHHKDFLSIPLEQYEKYNENMKTFQKTKKVFGESRELVMTYSEKLKKKQEHTFRKGLEDFEWKIWNKYHEYKETPIEMTKGIQSIYKASRYRNYLEINIDEQTGLIIRENSTKLAERYQRFGKNLLFTSKKDAKAPWIVSKYHSKNVIEDSFRSMKDCELIRIRPIRHWTDTKIRAYIFCCVMAFVLMRLMVLKVEKEEVIMSFHVLKQELTDFREIIMIYTNKSAERKISEGSTIQKKLYQIFKLDEISKKIATTL